MLLKSTPRIAVYGRHSTAKQTATSSADQAAACGRLVDALNGEIVDVYLDPEMSGYKRARPGLERLLADVRDGRVDIVVAESLDRLARDAEDVAWIGKKLGFDRVQLHTLSEGHVDEVKFAVAGLLGTIFLKQLIEKTRRGLEAVVLSGRLAGGRAYGYSKVIKFDAKGDLIAGLREIDEAQAVIIRRIFSEFAGGMSSVMIATRLNEEHVPGPTGGQWNASTIRGDPKKCVGILNNPLYRGQIIWNRREWRKNPDSDERERVYRLRNKSEWIEIEAPTLRIVDNALWTAVEGEMDRRSKPRDASALASQRRQKHLLSGIVKCAECGSNYVISGKDYYRCAAQKERGTCANTVSVRKAPLEIAALAVLQDQLLTDDHARMFVEEYKREMNRQTTTLDERDNGPRERLAQIEVELANLSRNLLAGVLGPTLAGMLANHETEKAELEARLAKRQRPPIVADILPHPKLMELFHTKVAALHASLDDECIRTEAATTLRQLIESVTIYPHGPHGPEAEVVASAGRLLRFAMNENSPVAGATGAVLQRWLRGQDLNL